MTLGIAQDLQPAVAELGTTVDYETTVVTDDQVAGTVTSVPDIQSPQPKGVPESFNTGLIDGNNIRFGDLMMTFLAPDLTVAPEVGTTRVKYFDKWYTVLAIEPFADGDAIAAYRLHLRSG